MHWFDNEIEKMIKEILGVLVWLGTEFLKSLTGNHHNNDHNDGHHDSDNTESQEDAENKDDLEA